MRTESATSQAGSAQLKRELGTGMSTALVIGNMVGSGVFLLPASLAGVVLIALVAFAFSFWAIYGAGLEYVGQGYLLLLAGVPVYLFLKWRQSRSAAGAPAVVEPPEADVGAPEMTPMTTGHEPGRVAVK